MVDVSSLTTMSTHFRHGSFSFCTCFFTMASKARSGVKRPVLRGKRRRARKEATRGREECEKWTEEIRQGERQVKREAVKKGGERRERKNTRQK